MIKTIFILFVLFLAGSVLVSVYPQLGEVCQEERPKYRDRLIEPDFNLSLPKDLYDMFVIKSTNAIIKEIRKHKKCEAVIAYSDSNSDFKKIVDEAKENSAEVIDRGYYYQINYDSDNNILYLNKDGLSKLIVRFSIVNGKNTSLLIEGKTPNAFYRYEVIENGSGGRSFNGETPQFFTDAENNTKEYFKNLGVEMLVYNPDKFKMPTSSQ